MYSSSFHRPGKLSGNVHPLSNAEDVMMWTVASTNVEFTERHPNCALREGEQHSGQVSSANKKGKSHLSVVSCAECDGRKLLVSWMIVVRQIIGISVWGMGKLQRVSFMLPAGG